MMDHELYKSYEKFLSFYSTHVLNIDENAAHHPANVASKIIERYGPSKAFQGLKQAINDMVSESFSLSQEDVKKIDKFFSDNGVLTLTFMRAKFSKKYSQIIKREKIKDLDEYYLVKNITDDRSLDINNDEMNILFRMMESFEQSM